MGQGGGEAASGRVLLRIAHSFNILLKSRALKTVQQRMEAIGLPMWAAFLRALSMREDTPVMGKAFRLDDLCSSSCFTTYSLDPISHLSVSGFSKV